MIYLKKLSLAITFFLMTIPAHSAMVSTPELILSPQQMQLIEALQNQQVRNQLIEKGVDPVAASERVKQMTPAEVTSLQGKIDQLPAGAGMSSMNLLLVIIILILII